MDQNFMITYNKIVVYYLLCICGISKILPYNVCNYEMYIWNKLFSNTHMYNNIGKDKEY